MMNKLLERGEEIARDAQRRSAERVAARLRAELGAGSVQVEAASVIASGRGIMKRWLLDPSLRFLGGGLK